MKREAGFSLVEVLVAVTLMLVIMGATLGALTDAIHATEGVTLMADTQDNLRASMNYVVRDLTQAGEGLPQTGITIPNTGGATPVSAVNRPGPSGIGTFSTSWTVLPVISPGYEAGATTTASGVATDVINILYADNTLIDSSQHWLNEYPINTSGGGSGCSGTTPTPNGTISTTAGGVTTITFDSSCININTGNTALAAGNLLLLQANGGGMALVYITAASPSTNTVTIGTTPDPFALNASGKSAGTISQIQSPAGSRTYTTTTATRVWMITYYVDNSDTLHPQLMRQVNFGTAQAIGNVIENLQFFYDYVNNPGLTPPAITNSTGPTISQLPYVRDVYVWLYARSENPYTQTGTYFRNNLETAVSIRSLNFYNEFK